MKLKSGVFFTIIIIVISFFAGILSLTTLSSLKVMLVPALASWLTFILAIIQLTRELRGERQEQIATQQEVIDIELTGKKDVSRYLLAFGWMVGLLLAIYFVGYLIAITLFMFLYLKLHSHSWFISMILTASATILMYVIFVVLLKVTLFPGVLFDAYL